MQTAVHDAITHTPPALGARMVRAYLWIANRRLLACCLVLIATLSLRAALLPWMPVTRPHIHDEFSYLLASDTYAHGRLANVPHPFWQHFETFQVLQQPVYASKYQPLQGMVLAFGQRVFDQPWIGVFLSTGFLCAVVCWMLQVWISPGWALLGALLFLLRVGVLSYWMNSYEGGAVPGIGGALALGAVVRIIRGRQFRQSMTWALGLAVVMLSRPYDAAVLGVATGAILLWWLVRSAVPLILAVSRIALPAFAVLAVSGAGIAYNNYRVTGNALTLPYQVHDRQYVMASMFAFMPLRPELEYRHATMRAFYADWNVGVWRDARAWPLASLLGKIYIFCDFFFSFWPLLIPLLFWPYALRTEAERLTIFLLAIFLLMIAPLIAVVPHYGAAFSGVIYLRFLQGLQRLRAWRANNRPIGHVLAISLVVLFLLAFGNTAIRLIFHRGEAFGFGSGRDAISQTLAERSSRFGSARDSIVKALAVRPGRHLVLVRYRSSHNLQEEWVYNRADIDSSPIVWAREMNVEQDRPFIEYFHDRQVWLLEPDQNPPRLTPYSMQGAPVP